MVEDGFVCQEIDFEGVGDLSPIPEFDGVSSPDWLGIVDADAGGSGNFANEPSPETIAFWLGGATGSREILFATPAAKVECFYSSSVPFSMVAFGEDDSVIDIVTAPANYDNGPGGDPTGDFNQWDPISIESTGNTIVRIEVSGEQNQTGIDDLKICRKLSVHSVEFTQAIQEWQELQELKDDLAGDGEPPVPMIAGKPAVMRVYLEEVQSSTTVSLEVSGVTEQSREISLQPNCTPEQQRRGDNGCASANFYFTPPEGSWTITLKTLDEGGKEIESHEFPFSSTTTDVLSLKAVSVCDSTLPIPFFDIWRCGNAGSLGGLVDFFRRTAPTHRVRVSATNHKVRRRTSDFDANGDGTLSGREMGAWWIAVAGDINNLFTLFDLFGSVLGVESYYYGMVRPSTPGGIGGIASNIPSRGAASRTSAVRLGAEVADEVVAHEIGHMLGRRHTNNAVPAASGGTPPGCYNLAQDGGTDWPFADSRIRSSATDLEVGFDVSARQPLIPERTFDWMSYCVPRWVSPFTYLQALNTLSLQGSAGPSVVGVEGEFWSVSGVIEAAGKVSFEPLFLVETEAPDGQGTGTHRIEVLDAASTVLFTRSFVPFMPASESTEEFEAIGLPAFSELIPVQPGASALRLVSGSSTVLGTLTLEGTAPVVTIEAPAGSEMLDKTHTIAWSILDPDSSAHTSWVEYSNDGGASWISLGRFEEATSVDESFDDLPGGDGSALVRVSVSDGVNSGSAVSNSFSVATKLPEAEILAPEAFTVFTPQDQVWLRGTALDGDDGYLDGESVFWDSDRDGLLGVGTSLTVSNLSAGTHEVTFFAMDLDGNVASATRSLTIVGERPTVALDVQPLDTLPTTCVQVSVDASTPLGVEQLDFVEYSLNGGATWIPVEVDQLPFQSIVPGDGFFHIVARAVDLAGQVDVADDRVFIDSPCLSIPNFPPVINGSLRGGATGVENEAEFIVRSRSADVENGRVTTLIELFAESGQDTSVIVLDPEDRVRLKVGAPELKVVVPKPGQALPDGLDVRAQANSFTVVFTAVDPEGGVGQDEILVDRDTLAEILNGTRGAFVID